MESELKSKYRHVLDGVSQIPSLPSLVSRLISVLNSKRSNADDVCRLLEMDVGLSGKVLRLANSSYYNPSGEVSSVHRAVIKLGFNAISSIVVSASVYSLFKNPQSPVNMNRVAFWRHSVEVALNARVLATAASHHLDPETAFTQGMLHDIGALVLDLQFPQEYATLMDDVRHKGITLEQAERHRFGMDHSEVGAEILTRWGIPEIVRIPIQQHHQLDAFHGYREYTMVLVLANQISHQQGGFFFPQQVVQEIPTADLLEQLGIRLSPEALGALIDEEKKRAKLVMNLLRS